jgi:hypothetical protein
MINNILKAVGVDNSNDDHVVEGGVGVGTSKSSIVNQSDGRAATSSNSSSTAAPENLASSIGTWINSTVTTAFTGDGGGGRFGVVGGGGLGSRGGGVGRGVAAAVSVGGRNYYSGGGVGEQSAGQVGFGLVVRLFECCFFACLPVGVSLLNGNFNFSSLIVSIHIVLDSTESKLLQPFTTQSTFSISSSSFVLF